MKNPNGYGCIKHLSGSRRNPWVFVVTEHGKQRAKGYFPTKLEALAFQVDWNKSHDRHHLSSEITFAELYMQWKPKHVEYFHVSESTVKGYESAYRHCSALYDMAVEDIRYKDLQAVIDSMQGLSYASKKKVPNLLKSDINRRQKYLKVTKSKTAAGIRLVPIHHLIWPLIEKRLKSDGPYLVNIHGKPYDYSRFARTFKRVMKLV